MPNQVLPVLFMNLSGEMLYVLDQRLQAQEVEMRKGNRVMGEIVSNVFNESMITELFKPQVVYSKKNLCSIYQKLVNSSIMRIDPASMEKLYDLMLMNYKHQVVKSRNLLDILHVTLNHVDSILDFVKTKPEAEKLALRGYHSLVKLCSEMSPGELILVKQSLLSFLHDLSSKVSVLINMGEQNPDGSFIISNDVEVPLGFETPGTIKYCDDGRTEKFTTGAKFRPNPKPDFSSELHGQRLTQLGLNLYGKDQNIKSFQSESSLPGSSQNFAEAESKLLGHLMGASTSKTGTFTLNLFSTGPKNETIASAHSDVEESSTSAPKNLFNITAEKVENQELSDIQKDFSNLGRRGEQEDDLLAMMDSA